MKPKGQMFLGVFHACSVVGDIVEGMLHFESMSKNYDIVLSMEQYVGVISWELGAWDRCAEIVELLDPSRLDEQSKAGFLAVKPSKEKEKKSAQSLLRLEAKGLKQLMKEDGYTPETKFVLHDVDQETKEDVLMAHNEKLAFAQGFMNSSARSPIRIIKNLRVCGDCHNALKIASKLVGQEIIMLDAKRFHHLNYGL
ncbi:hypothetical protein RND71_032077 [Anisodus tanguticus]|uniref:DYW domain-containing protein n=1 Tax=Anisodus tanguticus TaxID=243964 RepID=A0AAE1REQ4_9SOLA|nr:hypothetical protein RND71_032077 [Anisodus tanguticus]